MNIMVQAWMPTNTTSLILLTLVNTNIFSGSLKKEESGTIKWSKVAEPHIGGPDHDSFK